MDKFKLPAFGIHLVQNTNGHFGVGSLGFNPKRYKLEVLIQGLIKYQLMKLRVFYEGY